MDVGKFMVQTVSDFKKREIRVGSWDCSLQKEKRSQRMCHYNLWQEEAMMTHNKMDLDNWHL